MRVALVYDGIGGPGGGGGIARAILELGSGLNDQGHEVVLVVHDFKATGEFERITDGLDVRAVRTDVAETPSGYPALIDRYWLGMRRLAACVPDDVDVINAHNLPALRAGRLAARRLGVPLVWNRFDDTVWERAVIPEMTSRGAASAVLRGARVSFGLFDVHNVRSADEIVVSSDFDREMVQRAFRRRATVLRPGPADAFLRSSASREQARRELGVEGGDFLVLAFALLVPHRRFEDLIEAAAILRDEPQLRVLIAGTDSYVPEYGAQLERLIVDRNLQHRVTLDRRSLADAELRAMYAAADLYVFPPSRQSYGLAPLEALARGTRVVVSSGAGVHEVLEGRAGVTVVSPGRPDEIAAAIRAARDSDDPAGLEETRSWLRRELSNDAYAKSMAALFERASERNH